MSKIRTLTGILLIMLLALPAALSAADTFSINPVNIVPGTEKTISLSLSNDQQYYGFQTDLVLPEGLSIATKANGSLDIALTDRAASSFSMSANEISTGTIRMVCFSSQHVPFTGSSGALVKIRLKASAEFNGGQILLTNTIFSNSQNKDVRLADSKITVSTKEVNTLSIDDVTMDAGEGKYIPVILNNETDFTAYQFDVNLPEGLSVDFNLTKKTERCMSGHQLSYNQLSDSKVRFVCYSTNNDILKGNSGAILNLWIKATKGATGSKQIKIDNIVFSSANATTYRLDPITGSIVIKYTPVTSITLDKSSATIQIDDTLKLHATVLPADASNKAVLWSSSNAEISSVDANGLVTAKKSGNCVITVLSADGKTKAECSIQVNKWPLKIAVNNATRRYGEENPQFTFSYTGFKGNDNEKSLTKLPTASTSATIQSAIGNYDIIASGAESDKYEMSYTNGTLSITKAPLTISAGNYMKKQGDPMPAFKASYDGFKNNETEDVLTKKPMITTTATESSAPGEYPVTVSGAEAQNYDISYQPGTLTVTEADAVIITAKSYSRAYGDNNPTFEYEVQGAQLDGVPEITCEAVKGSPVGTYAIVVKQGTVKNYNVTFANGTLTVTKAPLTISAGNYTKKQGDPMPAFKASYDGFKNNETEDVLTKKPVITTTATESSAPGEYPVTVSGAEARNYDISYQPGTLIVTEADAVIITAKSYSRVYGDNNPTFEYEVQGAQLDGVPEITCEAVKNSPVGTYAIVVKQGSVKNYNVSFANGTLTVTKAPLTVSAGNYTKKQGNPMPEFKAIYQGFKNNETEDVLTKKPVITTTATESSAPGSYPVTVSGAEAQNYDISYQPGTLTVTEADAVIITAKSYSRVYGDNNPTFEYEVQGAQLDGVPEITCEATKDSPVGTYAIVVKQGSVKNYNVTFANGTLTITKAPLTISAGNYTKKQGDPMPTFKAVYNGFKNNETEDVLTKKPTITTTATESSAPGNYPVTVSGAEAQNYDISYQPGTLTVTEADAVIITAKSYSRVYGDNNPTFEYEVQGAQLDGVPEITCEAVKDSPVGTYAIVVKQGSVKNYNVSFANGTLIITKAPLTVSAGNYTKKQGDAMPEFKASYQGFKNNETEDVLTKKPVITTTATESSAPGNYPVTVSGAEAQNYDISYQPGTLTVTEADAVIITAKSYSRIYGDNNPTFEYEVQGAQLDGVPEITCEATKDSPVGTYAIVVKQGTVKNYNVSFANGTLTVTKAPLTVSAGNYTKKQGDPMPAFKASYEGFKNNETEDVLTKKPVITTTATDSSAPGEYPVIVSDAEGQNYDISYQQGTLTVTEAEVSDPVITLNGNELSISCGTARAIIYYTLNGKDPDENSPVYTEPIPLEASCQIKAVAKLFDVKSNIVNSEYHNPQYPNIIKVGDVCIANIINNGVDSLPMFFKVTSVYPFEVSLVKKEDYVEGWSNENISGDIEVPSEIICAGTKLRVTEIDRLALSSCTHTGLIKLNEGLKTIRMEAFRWSAIKELVVPNSVEVIEGAFVTECHSLKTLMLGTGLQILSSDVFWCVDIQYLYSLNPIPPKFDDPNHSFDDTPVDKITLYVPIGSKSAYENAPGWNLFAGRIVEIDPTGIAGVTADGLSITVSNHRIHVEGAAPNSMLSVYDLSGNKCLSVRITSGNANINCDIPNGVYVVRLGNVSKKIVL